MALIGQDTGTAASGTTVVVTLTRTTIGGELLVGCFCNAGGNGTGVAGNVGAAWTLATNGRSNAHNICEVWFLPNAPAGLTTVTYTHGTSAAGGGNVSSWNDDLDSPGDTGANANGVSTAPASGSITPGILENLVVGVAVTNVAKTGGPTGTTTALTELNWTGTRWLLPAYIIQTAATGVNAGWTLGSSANWDAVIASFKNGQKPKTLTPYPQIVPQ